METVSDAAVNVVNALLFAQERGVQVDERLSSEHEDYASLITVVYHTSKGQRLLAGTIFGKSDPRLVHLDEYIFDAVPRGTCSFTSTTMSRASSAKSARSWAATMYNAKCRAGVANGRPSPDHPQRR